MDPETVRDFSEVTQHIHRWQNWHQHADVMCLGFFLWSPTTRSKNSHPHCPKALMHSECFHFHYFTVC